MRSDFDKKLKQKIVELMENDFEPYNSENWEKVSSKLKNKIFIFGNYSQLIAASIAIISLGIILSIYIYHFSGNSKDHNIPSQINVVKKDTLPSSSITKEKIIIPLVEKSDLYTTTKDNNRNEDDDILKIETNSYYNNKTEEKLNNTEKPTIENSPSMYVASTDFNSMNIRMPKQIDKLVRTLANNSKKKLVLSEKDFPVQRNFNITVNQRSIGLGAIISSISNLEQADGKVRLGFGGGIRTSIPIYDNVDISMGILFYNQKINSLDKQTLTTSTKKQLQSIITNLWSLDFPINIKYNFKFSKLQMFLTAGFSSITNISENIELSYVRSKTIATNTEDEFGNPILVFNVVNTVEKENKKQESFKIFHFAKILNLSFGFELPYKNTNMTFFLEPYFKYFLGSITSENLKYSSLGFNMILQF